MLDNRSVHRNPRGPLLDADKYWDHRIHHHPVFLILLTIKSPGNKGLKRKRTSISSGVKKAKNRKKPTTNKKQGQGLKKKFKKANLRRRQIKKEIS